MRVRDRLSVRGDRVRVGDRVRDRVRVRNRVRVRAYQSPNPTSD